MTHFDPAVAGRQVMSERVTVLYPAFPTIANDLLHAQGFSSEALPELRRINCVAPPDGLRRLQQSFAQAAVTSVYGLTEAGGVVAYGEADDPLEVRVSSCGTPFDGIEARIGPADDDPTGSGHVGEIQLRGWCLFAGYFEQAEATLAAMTEDGWLRTGDLGSFDAEGRIQYRGRLKDVIKVGGENVSALEIESVLMREPAVKLAQVIGMADERFGEVPVAFVELHPGSSCSPAELHDACRVRLAGFKLPRRILFVTEWPMSATKIQKHRLREQLKASGTPS
jgi:acyl-CoA synthetase (AMP-forming)/AMP-acid ligase II